MANSGSGGSPCTPHPGCSGRSRASRCAAKPRPTRGHALPPRRSARRPPAPAVVVPICEAGGHVPVLAWASPHSGTPAIFPSSPGGVCTVIPPSRCSPSWRENVTLNGLKPPAWLFVVPALNDGLNPPPHPVLMLNVSDGVTAGVPLQGVSDVWVWNVPHDGGVMNGARRPPKKCSFRSLNGSCGLLANVVVSCPVLGSASTWPASLTTTPVAGSLIAR